MRIVFIVCISLACILSLGMLYVMLTSETIDWLGMSVFLTAITVLIGAALTGKVKQKQIEEPNNV